MKGFHHFWGSMTVGTALVLILGLFTIPPSNGAILKNAGKQTWGYVEVRPGAHMFWWLYYTTASEDYTKRPLVLWIQGGPGASSTGYGNFMEIGPLDVNLNNRTHSWVNEANVLFVDNPVGAGFSFVNDTKLLARNNSEITSDLITMLSEFLEKVPEFKKVPLYIFSESYGGKMAAQFALRLNKKVTAGKLKCNLKGVSLGDSWISPIDSVLTWAPFLYSTSMVDNSGFALVNASAYAVKAAIDRGDYKKATQLWDKTEQIIYHVTNGVNVYNILETSTDDSAAPKLWTDKKADEFPSVSQLFSKLTSDVQESEENNSVHRPFTTESDFLDGLYLAKRHLHKYKAANLSELMNGKIKDMLRIIPKNVTWGGQQDQVFAALTGDFMTPVVRVVESLLNSTSIAVNVYNGQLDMIVDTMGTIKWVENMKWAGQSGWRDSPRTPIIINKSTEMFVKSYKNFGFYWILKAGHMVPADAPETGVEMLKLITKIK